MEDHFEDKYYATFEYHRVPDIEIPKRGRTTFEHVFPLPISPKGGISQALLYDKEGGYPIFVGTAFCSHEEQFKKLKGRSIAFGRLLREVNLISGLDWAQKASRLFTKDGTEYDWELVRKAYKGEKIP